MPAVGGGLHPCRDLGKGLLYVAFVIDAFARRIVRLAGVAIGPRLALCSMLPEQALYHRRPFLHGLVHHSDRGSQYVSIRYTERLAEAGIEPSVGSVGDSYDNALAGDGDRGSSRPR